MIPYAIGKFFQRRRGGAFGQEKVGAGECAAAGEKESQGRPAGGIQPVWPHGAAADLELVLLWMMWRWFNNDFEWFAACRRFTVLMFFHLFNSDMDATGKLTWMFLLAVIPIPASIFLWFTEKDVGPPHPEADGAAADRREPGSAASGSGGAAGPGDRILRHRRSVPLSQPAAALFPVCQHGDEVLPQERTSLRRCWRSCKRRRSSFFWSTSSSMRGICGAAS